MEALIKKRIEEAANEICCTDCPFENIKNCKECVEKENAIKTATFALQNQWISVEEDLPPYDEAVIGMDYMPELDWDDQTIIFVHRSNNPDVITDKNKFCVYPPRFCKVTHWMPIPRLEGGEKWDV